jgi:hypothetical protein
VRKVIWLTTDKAPSEDRELYHHDWDRKEFDNEKCNHRYNIWEACDRKEPVVDTRVSRFDKLVDGMHYIGVAYIETITELYRRI